jgi:hypothetical protein
MSAFGSRGPGESGGKPSLDGVSFDNTGFTPQGEPETGRIRVWHTPEGDGLGVYFFSVPPNLPPNAGSVDELADFYRRLVGDSGGKLVEVSVSAASGLLVVRTISSAPQKPTGRTYVGSLTLPFRDFSFVIKCQCAEHGTTGVKEAILMARSRAAKEPMTIEGGRFHIPGWNPDDPKHDAAYPNHPVARVRRVLDHVAGSLVVAEDVRGLPGFPLPTSSA